MQVTKGNYEKETRCEESSEEGQGGSGGARMAAQATFNFHGRCGRQSQRNRPQVTENVKGGETLKTHLGGLTFANDISRERN